MDHFARVGFLGNLTMNIYRHGLSNQTTEVEELFDFSTKVRTTLDNCCMESKPIRESEFDVKLDSQANTTKVCNSTQELATDMELVTV